MGLKIFLFLATVAHSCCGISASKVICYYDHTSYYREGQGKFEISSLEPALQFCTHLIYGYAGISEQTHKLISLDEQLDISKNNFRHVTNLKSTFPGLKILLSVGGGHDGKGDSVERSKKYLALLETIEDRLEFSKSAVGFLKTYGFDGLDLGWQFPETQVEVIRSTIGGWWNSIKTKVAGEKKPDYKVQEHKEQFTALVRELHNDFKHDGLLLSVSVLPNVNSTDYFDISAITKDLDFVTLKAFDFYNPERYPKKADYAAPLYEALDRKVTENVDHQVRHWSQNGCPSNKVILGIPTFARTWKITSESVLTGVPPLEAECPAEGGQYTKTPGLLSYAEVCLKLANPHKLSHDAGEHLIKVGDPTHRYGTYAYRLVNAKNPAGVWASYEDTDTAGNKATYAKAKGLGGIALDDLSLDDFRALCSGNRFPILRSAVVRM